METIVVQTRGKYQKYRLSGSAEGSDLKIGRAYSNDVIIDDPYIGPEQLVLRISPGIGGHWRIVNMDKTNPVLVNRQVIDDQEFDVQSGDQLTIGRTTFHLYAENHVMPEAKEFSFTNWLHNHKLKPLFALAMLLVLFSVTLWMEYLQQTDQIKWGRLSVTAFAMVFLAIVWASIWAVAGRFIKSNYYFFSHVFFTALALSLMVLLGSIYSYVDYVTSSVFAGEIVDWLVSILLFGLLVGFNIALVSYRPGAFKKGVAASIVIYGAIGLLQYLYQDDYSNVPEHSNTMKPAYVPVPPPVNIETYIDGYDALFDSVS